MRRLGTISVASAAAAAIGSGILFGSSVLVGDELATTPEVGPVSTALGVSRRSDPSIDRYTRSPRATTPLRRMTSAQTWLSTRASPFVAHDSDPTVSLNLVGWASGPDVHAYVNATGVNLYNPEAQRSAAKWLVRSGGKPVLVDAWSMLDIRQPGARRFWLYGSDGEASCTPNRNRRAALDLIACGYTGLWVDNVLTQPAQWFKPDPKIDPGPWGDALVALLTELRAALPSGVPFTINAHWTDVDFPYAGSPALDPQAALVRTAKLADQLVIEGGAIDPGVDYAGAADAAWSYPRLLQYADALHDAGAKVQWEKVGSEGLTSNAVQQLGALPPCLDVAYGRPGQAAWKKHSAAWRGHVRTSGFNLATALLTFAPGDSVGDLCEYPGRGFPGYGVDLGPPIGERSVVGDLTVRAFERGYVAVNASMRDASLTLPGGRRGVDVASRASTAPAATSVFSLPPRTAVIAGYR
ncbi:MAG: hypothetical protein Q7T55_16760 [Solirubrobacteraceae bacterium]|nr:hypothetical protein [Solirubrobacteraceae bacterium]